jgi:transcriptional regulator of acetoin/glycerol metabolism
VEVFARRMGKRIDPISQTILDAFISYPWPGNVRELQNLIERAVIRSDNGVLPNPLPDKNPVAVTHSRNGFRDSTRALILHALLETRWVIGGPAGAAARLGLKRTTLIAKMKKLGISRAVRQSDVIQLPCTSDESVMAASSSTT